MEGMKKRFTSHPEAPKAIYRLPALLLIASLCGFRSSPPLREHTVPYNSAETAWSHSAGTGAIEGVATWNFGRRWPCGEISLFARSAYADETFMAVYGNLDYARYRPMQMKGIFRSVDPNFRADARTTQCQNDGKFEFSGLPAGTYYLTTRFLGDTNIIRLGTFRGNQQEYVFKRVDVSDGQVVNVDLQEK